MDLSDNGRAAGAGAQQQSAAATTTGFAAMDSSANCRSALARDVWRIACKQAPTKPRAFAGNVFMA
jgi:hypothetical protein